MVIVEAGAPQYGQLGCHAGRVSRKHMHRACVTQAKERNTSTKRSIVTHFARAWAHWSGGQLDQQYAPRLLSAHVQPLVSYP